MPDRLRIVDAVTMMQLSVPGPDADVAETWHRARRAMGVQDDGSGEGRIARIGRWRPTIVLPPSTGHPCEKT